MTTIDGAISSPKPIMAIRQLGKSFVLLQGFRQYITGDKLDSQDPKIR